MISFNILYLILPFLLYSLQLVILTKYSRMNWSLQIAFYRQLWIFLVWIPLLYFFPIDFKILMENIIPILITSLIWAIYLYINFKSLNYISVAIWKVFATSSRIIITILTWVLLLSNDINLYQWLWIILLLLWIFLLLKKEKFKYIWIVLSILAWILLVANWYFFIQYSINFNPIIAWYILETVNWIFLFIMLILLSFKNKTLIKQSFKIKKGNFLIIFLTSPLVLIATMAIAKSYEIYSFIMVWVVLTMAIPVTMIFWYFLLKEKLSFKSIISIFIITISIVIIKIFW